MSSKRRLRRKSCEGKSRYNKKDADIVAWKDRNRTGHWIRSYKCNFCKGWHVGHPTRQVRQAVLARGY